MPVAVRRRQRAVPHAAPDRPVLRTQTLSLGHAPQRSHPLLHRPSGDPRPGAVQPDGRTDRHPAGDAQVNWSSAALKRELNERSASPLFCRRNQPVPLLLRRDRREASLSTAFARLPHRRAPRHRVRPCRRARGDLRYRDPRQTPALLPHRLHRLLAPNARWLRAGRAGHRRSDGCRRRGGEALRRAGDVRRPGKPSSALARRPGSSAPGCATSPTPSKPR